jgi:Mg-chelatase subunit ChlD
MAISRSERKVFVAAMATVQLAASCWLSGAPAQAADDAKPRPHIDLAFCIDTTSSMGSEIENVKKKTKEIVAKVAGGKPSPVVRVGLVAYRDRGDAYVTKVFPFTENIDQVVKDISDLQAQGGGDAPESVNEALHVSVHDLKWSSDHKTVKLLFLIGDAGPHFYPNDYDWHTEARQAVANGIVINTIGCQGLESMMPASQGIDVWKGIAQLADGKYEPLSYRHEIADASGKKTTIVSSAGHLYKVAPGAAGGWTAGADSLAAKGEAREVTAASLPMNMPTALSGETRGVGKVARAAYAAASPAMQNFSSRDENNLTDLVLDATKAAAKKKLNIDFKD